MSHVNVWDPETTARLATWATHFAAQGADAFTAERRAMAMLYRETVAQAQLLAYTDDFWMLALSSPRVPLLLPVHAPRPPLRPRPRPRRRASERECGTGEEALRDAPDHM